MASELSFLWFSVAFLLFFNVQVTSQTTNGYARVKPNHTVGETCGYSYCSGDCCIDSSSESEICCDDDNGDYMWWFWIAFVVMVLVFLMCFGVCCRIYRRQPRRHYLVITQESQPIVTNYGTESIAPIIRGVPSAYAYPQAKLPPYTQVAEDKGNPPRYQ